jgi:hypothetical protein
VLRTALQLSHIQAVQRAEHIQALRIQALSTPRIDTLFAHTRTRAREIIEEFSLEMP